MTAPPLPTLQSIRTPSLITSVKNPTSVALPLTQTMRRSRRTVRPTFATSVVRRTLRITTALLPLPPPLSRLPLPPPPLRLLRPLALEERRPTLPPPLPVVRRLLPPPLHQLKAPLRSSRSPSLAWLLSSPLSTSCKKRHYLLSGDRAWEYLVFCFGCSCLIFTKALLGDDNETGGEWCA